MSIGLLVALIAILMLVRVPIAFAFLGPGLAYVALQGGSAGLALRTAVVGIDSFALLAVPLFVLVGTLANQSGIAARLFDFALALLGRVRGNLAYVNVGTSLVFSWMSGSAVADAAGLGKVQIPRMVKDGYPFRFAAGLTASSSLIAPVMPPSIPAVIYASVATVSTGALFAASMVPALLMTLGLVIYVFFWVRKRKDLETIPFSFSRVRQTGVRVVGALGVPVIVLGGILGGFFTPTEAAGVGAGYVLLLGLIYRELNLKKILTALKEAAAITATIAVIIAAAALFGWILARERVPQMVAETMLAFTDNALVFLIIVNILLIILGMVIDASAAILVTVPVLLPVAIQFGVDPIHFGVIMIVNLMIGLLTPPVGTVLYVISTVSRRPVSEVFGGVLPFLIPMVSVLIIVTAFPAVVSFVPTMLGL